MAFSLLELFLAIIAFALTVHSISVMYYVAEKKKTSQVNSIILSDQPLYDQILLVWSCGWITAASTSLGALPLYFIQTPSGNIIAVFNAIAAGMMAAASLGLLAEGYFDAWSPNTNPMAPLRKLLGILLGVVIVKGSSLFLSRTDFANSPGESVIDTKRALLVLTVMTVHSISEGIGIGVSFHSETLGELVSAALAIHNIPEGVTVAMVLYPCGYSLLSISLLCLLSSLPQPLVAIPAYLCTTYFELLYPIGMGVATGAMLAVVFDELLPDAMESLSLKVVCGIFTSAGIGMVSLQIFLSGSSWPDTWNLSQIK